MAELMPVNGVGMVTARDGFVIGARDELVDRFSAFQRSERNEDLLHSKFDVPRKAGWSILDAQDALQGETDLDRFIHPIIYRPFDQRHIFYEDHAVWRTVHKVMDHARLPENFSLAFNRTVEERREYTDVFAFSGMIQHHSLSLKEVNYLAPLYLHPGEVTLDESVRLNFDPKLYAAICEAAGIDPADSDMAREAKAFLDPSPRSADAESPSPAREEGPADFRTATGEARPNEVKVFDYIYGVLHAPAYRETFAEFLKIDFPRVPYPPSPEVFRRVSEKGEQLRRLHLMEPAAIGETPYPYHGQGDDVVASGYPKWESPSPQPLPPGGEGAIGSLQINSDQYFADVPEIAWTFHIGGYQPAQKWLKDRRGRTLSWDDIGHYQKIVKILVETDRIMKEIKLSLE